MTNRYFKIEHYYTVRELDYPYAPGIEKLDEDRTKTVSEPGDRYSQAKEKTIGSLLVQTPKGFKIFLLIERTVRQYMGSS